MPIALRHRAPVLPIGLDEDLRPGLLSILTAGDADALLAWQQQHGVLRVLEPANGPAWARLAWERGFMEVGDMVLAAGGRPIDDQGGILDWILSFWRRSDRANCFFWECLFDQWSRRPLTPRIRRWNHLTYLALSATPAQTPGHDRQRLMLHRLQGTLTAMEAQDFWRAWVQAIHHHPDYLAAPSRPEACLRPTLEFLLTQSLWRRIFSACPYAELQQQALMPPGIKTVVDDVFSRLDGQVVR